MMGLAAIMVLFCAVVSDLALTTASLEVNLVDTREELSGLNWETRPADSGWTELSIDDGNGIPLRTFQVCEIRTAGQNNWFKTDFIELQEGAKNVFVEIKFTIRSCHDLPQVATCKETFSLYYLEANSRHSGRDKYMNDKIYTKVDTIAAKERFPIDTHVTNTETRRVGPLKGKGLYLAFQDTGACMIIYYVRVYYKKCDQVVQNLAQFPATVTGPKRVSLVEVKGRCVPNSVWIDCLPGPNLHCNSEGRWNLPSGSCQCLPGFEPDENMTACIECIAGQYKSDVGNTVCLTCPDNSLSIKFAATKCICSAGYYRARSDRSSAPCTKPPSRPEMVEYVVNKTSVSLMWSPPSYKGGREDMTYSISCLRCDASYSLCTECTDTIEYEPDKRFFTETRVSVRHLSPHTNYRFRIYAYNGVSIISGQEAKFSEAMLKTSESAPSAVGRVRVIEKKMSEVLLNWDPPKQPNGVIREYEIQYYTNNIKRPRISRTNTTEKSTFRIRNLPPATSFLVQVRARNMAGYGSFSVPVVFRTLVNTTARPDNIKSPMVDPNPPENPSDGGERTPAVHPNTTPKDPVDQLHLVVGIAIACTFLILILGAAFIVVGIRKRTKKDRCQDIEVYPFFDNAVELIQSQHKSTPRTYIDPSTYGDPDKAVHRFAKEIDSFNVKKEDLMGSGEFGEVFKGILRPATPILCEAGTMMTSSTTATNQSSYMVVAIKTLKTGYTEKQKQDFLAEASVMGQFDHPNVIRLEGVVTRTTPLMIVTEYMENGSLDAFLEDRHFKGLEFQIFELVHMLRDIADGMKYLASMGYVHRDLAARNILVNGEFMCKVSDFGLSRILENIQDEETAMYTTRGGMIPVRWTAPEAITKRTFTSASDVWSFGIVMWEVLTHGERPYWEMPNPDVVHCVENGYRLPPPAFCPRILHNLMLSCWNDDRTRRPTFAQIVSQLDSMLTTPERLQDTINNTPVPDQAECIPESLDLSSLGQWLEDMNMTHYKEIMLRYGCVTAEQIIKLTASQLDEMGVVEPTMQKILLDGAEFLRQRLEMINNHGIAV